MSQCCLATVDEGHNVLRGVSLFLLEGEPLRGTENIQNFSQHTSSSLFREEVWEEEGAEFLFRQYYQKKEITH